MMGMDDGGESIAHDIGQGAATAAGNVASGVESAGRGIADAGAAAYGAVAGAASSAATTAADAAREAAAGARSGAASAMDAGAPGGASTGGEADAGMDSAPLDDAQIAAVAVAANNVDIEAARAAKRKTRNAQVKKFASAMVRDHTSANKQAAALVKRLGVTPEENDMSRAITQGGKDNLANLGSMKGKQFDRAYAEHEVAYHQEVLEALDKKLIPNARNPELKSLLQSVRAVVAQHLGHASALVDSLSR
jgi:putative membrane protein